MQIEKDIEKDIWDYMKQFSMWDKRMKKDKIQVVHTVKNECKWAGLFKYGNAIVAKQL